MTHAAMSRIAVESSAEARNNRSRSLKRAARTNASLTLVRRLTVFAVILTAMFILMWLEHIACLIQPYQPEVVSSGCARGGCAHGGCVRGGFAHRGTDRGLCGTLHPIDRTHGQHIFRGHGHRS